MSRALWESGNRIGIAHPPAQTDKTIPEPDNAISGGLTGGTQVDQKLEMLRQKAGAGDNAAMQELLAYKRQLKRGG